VLVEDVDVLEVELEEELVEVVLVEVLVS